MTNSTVDSNPHRPPCIDGDHCGEIHCPPVEEPGRRSSAIVTVHARPDLSPEASEALDALIAVATRQADQPSITPNPDGDGVILHLPEINYLDTQVWSVDIGLTAQGLAALKALLADDEPQP